MAVRHRFSTRVSVPAMTGRIDRKTGEFVVDAGRTKQSMAEECDINKILKRYIKTGTVAHVSKHAGEYGFAPALSFQNAMEMIRKGDEMFASLPAKVRKRFNNKPAEFLMFVQDEKNKDAMRELGLLKPIVDPVTGQVRQPTNAELAKPASSPAPPQ